MTTTPKIGLSPKRSTLNREPGRSSAMGRVVPSSMRTRASDKRHWLGGKAPGSYTVVSASEAMLDDAGQDEPAYSSSLYTPILNRNPLAKCWALAGLSRGVHSLLMRPWCGAAFARDTTSSACCPVFKPPSMGTRTPLSAHQH